MKKRSKLLCLLLTLVLLVSMFPLPAAADTTDDTQTDPPTGTVKIKVVVGKTTLFTYEVEVGDEPLKLKNDKYIKHNNKYYEFSYYTVSGKKPSNNKVVIDAYDSENSEAWQKKWGETIKVIYKAHKHNYKFSFGRIYHWSICDCGATTNEVRHVDPATDSDKICTCGYKFSDNTDLTTLWLTNMVLSPAFNKETTEYIGQVRTYLDVTSTTITAHPFDALATVKLPENLEIKEGPNKFEIVVTAEDKTATKTYTVIAVKPVKVENTFISDDGTNISIPLVSTIKNMTASCSPSEAVAAKVLEMAVAGKSANIQFQPEFSKWSIQQAEVTLTGEFLKNLSEQTEASLTIRTPYDSVLTVPHEQLAELAEGSDTVTFRIGKDNTFHILTVGEPITVSEKITLTVPETT